MCNVEILARLRSTIWNGDINHTEQVLSECFKKSQIDPTYYNVLGIVFEAEGAIHSAKTFYRKAQAAPSGCEAAKQNLERLNKTETSGAAQDEIELGAHEQFVNDLCDQADGALSHLVSVSSETIAAIRGTNND